MKIIRVYEHNFDSALASIKDDVLGFDLEATHTNKLKAHVAVIQVHQVSNSTSYLFPIANVVDAQLTNEQIGKLINLYKTKGLVGHSLAYDVGMMYKDFRSTPKSVEVDTYLLSCMCQREVNKLKVLAAEAKPELKEHLQSFSSLMDLDEELEDDTELFYSFNNIEQVKYMALDPYLPFIVYKYLMKPELERAFKLEMRAVVPLALASSEGLYLNMDEFNEKINELQSKAEVLQANIDKEVGYSIKVGSAKQVRVALFETLHLPVPPIKTPKGEISTSEESLKFLEGTPVVDNILELKHMQSIISSSKTLPDFLDDQSRVHPRFLQIGFDGTARIYSTKPAVNQWPWELRALVKAEPGKKFIYADWKSAELVIACYLAGQQDMLDMYYQGKDMHSYLAGLILNVEQPTREQRDISKVLTFATMFGSEGAAVARKLKCSEDKAKELVAKYNNILDKVIILRDRVHREAVSSWKTTTISGRIRTLPNMGIPTLVEKGKRQSFNTKIQGSCADLQKLAIAKLYYKYGEKFKFKFTVFDSFLIECNNEVTDEEIKEMLNDISDFSDEFPGLKLRYDYGVAYDWDSAHKLA